MRKAPGAIRQDGFCKIRFRFGMEGANESVFAALDNCHLFSSDHFSLQAAEEKLLHREAANRMKRRGHLLVSNNEKQKKNEITNKKGKRSENNSHKN
jgi:hypothetical protein